MARKYSKLNFVDAVKIITPDLYLEDDLAVSGNQVKLTDLLINSHLVAISKVSNTLNISSIPWSYSTSSINTVSGFSQYFVKQNKLTKISTYDFQNKILQPLGYKYSDYGTSAEFLTFLSGTLLPKIHLNSKTLPSDTSSAYAFTASATHEYLINNLSWLYFLNTSGPVDSPSSVVASSIASKLYIGKDYLINDGIKDYQRYLWTNYSNFSSLDPTIIPGNFQSGTGSYTSGTQNLKKLQTLIDVAYSPLYIDQEDTTVKDAINMYIGTAASLENTEPAGPFNKFLRGVSYSFRDIDNQVDSLQNLASITDCPSDYLPYLASLVGWKLYGNNPESWRNQIRNASRLYKKKGTKDGLVEAMNSIIVQNPIDVSSAITEMFESYIPQLIYYFLLTETDIFDPKTYTSEVAQSFGVPPERYSPTNKDHNIRVAVDKIMQNAVTSYPHLFFIKNEPFRVNVLENGTAWFGPTVFDYDTWYTGNARGPTSKRLAIKGDDSFAFKYRGSVMGIPPWDEPKFYRNSIVTKDLLDFFGKELRKYCISKNYIASFIDYAYQNILVANMQSDAYLDNGYVFLTSSVQYPPNYDDVIDNLSYRDYDALSLWSGKSSTFDFTVCSGDFSSILFQDSSSTYTKNEILDSLEIVDSFAPAKSIPRTKVVLSHNEYVSGTENACPSISYGFFDLPGTGGIPQYSFSGVSGILANFGVCGADIRATGKAIGENKYNGFDDSRSTVSHAKLPVFTREQTNFAFNASDSVVNTTLVVPPNEPIRRKSLRRRNFHNVLNQKGWYGRDGHNMPTFYNNTSSVLDFLPLGSIPSSLSIADGSPQNLSGVYSRDCANSTSDRSYFNVDVSNATLIRNFGSLDFSACDPFVKRGIIPEEVYTLFKFHELKKKAIAKEIINLNKVYTDTSANWFNFEDSYANLIEDTGFDKYLSPILDKRTVSRRDHREDYGLHYLYNTYNNYFLSSTDGSSLPENHLNTLKSGGPTILSHTYGPLYFNADFSVEGSSVTSLVTLPGGQSGNDLITTELLKPFNIQLNVSGLSLADAGVSAIEASNTPYYGRPEFIASHFLSGVSLIDTSSVDRTNLSSIANTFAIYNLNNTNRVDSPNYDNHLIENPSIFMETKGHGLPRIKFDLSGHTEMETNILLPEHDFELSVDFATGQTNTATLGGGNIGVLLRTKVETIKSGEKVVFFWTPNQEWRMVKVSNLANSTSGIDSVLSNAHFFSGNELRLVNYDGNCGETLDNTSVLKYLSKDDIVTAKINFHTKNNNTTLPFDYATYYNAAASSIYNGRRNHLHRANLGFQASSQDYVVEIFQPPNLNPERNFVVVDKINVIDKNLNAAAEIPYEAQIPDLNTQSNEGDKEHLLLPDGSVLGPTFKVMDGAEIITTALEQTDLLRNQLSIGTGQSDSVEPAYGYNQDLWAKESSKYQNKNAGYGRFLRQKFLAENPITNPPGTSPRPWGRVPFTGICNTTVTTHHQGVSEIDKDDLPFSEYSILWKNYWESRTGFLSINEWSPYINDGPRTMVGEGYNPNKVTGPGLGLAKWTRGSTITNNGNASDQYVQGLPLQALARPGQSYDEQWLSSEFKLGSLEQNQLATPWSGDTNPLGFTRGEDEFDYADIDDWGVGGLGDNPINRKTSVGSPIMMDFTTRRVKPDFDEASLNGAGPQDILNLQMQYYGDGNNWEYTPDSYYLSSTIMDPLGHVPSGLSMYSLWKVDLSPGTYAPGPGEEPDSFSIDDNFNDLVVDTFWDEGHGVTFPPNSVYRDIPRDRLVDTELYTFSVYVRGQNWKYVSPTQSDVYLVPYQDHWATSAIVTLSPIGSAHTYTRVVVKLGDMLNDGTTWSYPYP